MIKTDKSLGQHWLNDDTTLQAISSSACIEPGDVVLEVGPGTGTLTSKLLDDGASVVAVELDQRLANGLQKQFGSSDFSLHMQSILKFDLTSMPKNYKLVANIPYYLTSQLIRVVSESTNPPLLAVLLIQKEVAQRVCAGPGQASMLSITAQYYWQVNLGLEVPARLFTPPPKVDSQVVILQKRISAPHDIPAVDFFRLVRIGFSNKRKVLHNSLSAGLHIEKQVAREYLKSAKLKDTVRPQELSMDEWALLYNAVYAG